MTIDNQLRQDIRMALAHHFTLRQLHMLAEDVRPAATTVLEPDATDAEELAHALVAICEKEGLLEDLLVTAGARRAQSAVFPDLRAQLSTGPRPPTDPRLPTGGAGIMLDLLTANRDAYVGSTVHITNVLSRESESAGPSTAPIPDAEFGTYYLRHLLERYASLHVFFGGDPIPGYSQNYPASLPHMVQLLDVFVSVDLAPFNDRAEAFDSAPALERPPPASGAAQRYYFGPLCDRYPRLVVLGPPGSGKSVLLQHLAVLNAAAWLARQALPATLDPHALLTEAEIAQWDTPAQTAWRTWVAARDRLNRDLGWVAPRFPVFVNMRLLQNLLDPATQSLCEALENSTLEMGFDNCPAGFFERRLEAGDTILLLDAYDELGGPEARNKLARLTGVLLTQYLNAASAPLSNNRIVVTTRPLGYKDQLAPYQFVIWEINPLTPKQQTIFITQYYRAFAYGIDRTSYGSSASPSRVVLKHHDELAKRLLHQLSLYDPLVERPAREIPEFHDESLHSIAAIPLLLSLIVIQHYRGRSLPKERKDLYRICVESLVDGWNRFKQEEDLADTPTGIERPDPLSTRDKLDLLGGLALWVQKKRPARADQPAVISVAEAVRYIADQLRSRFAEKYLRALHRDLSPLAADQLAFWQQEAAGWIAGMEMNIGLIRIAGFDPITHEPVLEFAHAAFREYLTAWVLVNTANTHPPPEVLDHVTDTSWHEIILLYLLMHPSAAPEVARLLLAKPEIVGIPLLGRMLGEADLRSLIAPQRLLILDRLKLSFCYPERVPETFGEYWVSATVLRQIAKHDTGARDILEAGLGDPNSMVRYWAAWALRGLEGDPADIKAVLPKLVAVAFAAQSSDPLRDIRAAAASTVAVLGDPRIPAAQARSPRPPPLVRVAGTAPAGFHPGFTDDELTRLLVPLGPYTPPPDFAAPFGIAAQAVHLADYELGCFAVTNSEYAHYVAAGAPAPPHWIAESYPAALANHPVTHISWYEAVRYCLWLTEILQDGYLYRLPTDSEWEWAARGPARHIWAGGPSWVRESANNALSGIADTSAVGLFPQGAAWCGAHDLGGNCQTWTSSGPGGAGGQPAWSDISAAVQENRQVFAEIRVRGGSFRDSPYWCATAVYRQTAPDTCSRELGFRLVRIPLL